MNCKRIVFWQETPSPHQAPWVRSLAELLPDGRVTGVFSSRLGARRAAMGWHPPDYGKAQVVISPNRFVLKDLLARDPQRTIHIFSGGQNAKLDSTIEKALSVGCLVGILSEGRDWRRVPGVLRKLHSQINEGKYRNRVRFVLAMGHLAAKWFEMCGYSREQIFPFCYVVESEAAIHLERSNSSKVTLCFVGQLIERKRVDLLIQGLSGVKSGDWRLRVIGDGKQRAALEKLVHRLQLVGKIDFEGTLDNRTARRQLADSDVFVLPSDWDGWGAVVNEALMSGVPVICSDFCGASDLIRPCFNGELFECGSVDSLTSVLDKWISKGPLDVPVRKKIQNWSRCIEGQEVARYFIRIMDYLEGAPSERPKAPWLTEDGHQAI